MKKLTSFLLIFVMIFSIISVCPVSAADAKYYTWGDYRYEILKDGTVSIEEYKGNENVVVIPDKINNRKVTRIGDNSFLWNFDLKEVTLPKYLKYVENCAFAFCYNLKTVTFPPRSVKLELNAFLDCGHIEKVNISDLKAWCNTSFASAYANPMKGGGELYLNGKRIKNLKIPDGVKTVRKFAFIRGEYEKITIPDSVTKIYGKAFWCSTATEIRIGNGVELIGTEAFSGCYKLEKLTIGESVERIKKEAFRRCYNLESVTLPQGLKTIDSDAFYGCSGLAKIDIPESVEIVRKGAFKDTKWYKNQPEGMIYINNVAYKYKGKCPEEFSLREGTEYITGYAFYNMKNLKKFTMPDSVVSTGDKIFHNCNNLQKVRFSQNLSSITDSTFEGCSKLENPEIPASITSIGNYAFARCTEITSITLGENIESLGYGVFIGCENLTEVIFNNNPKKIPDDFFKECTALEEITLPDSVRTIGIRAFAGCTNLQNLPEGKNVKRYEDNAFEGCILFYEIVIPDKVTVIDRQVFKNCENIETLTIHKNVKKIRYEAFLNCRSLETVNYNAENCVFLWYSNVQSRNDVFEKCKNLRTLNIGENVKSLPQDMLTNALRNKLETINIPKSLKKIKYQTVDIKKKQIAKRSSNKKIVEVTKNGDIKLKSKGKAKVRFQRKDVSRKVTINVY